MYSTRIVFSAYINYYEQNAHVTRNFHAHVPRYNPNSVDSITSNIKCTIKDTLGIRIDSGSVYMQKCGH